MTTRSRYTAMPGHGITNKQPTRRPARQAAVRSARPPQRGPAPTQQAADSGDMVVLGMLLGICPLTFILGVFIPFFLWVFMGVALIALITMWAKWYFTFGFRAGFSVVLAGFMAVAFMFLPEVKAPPTSFEVLGGGTQALITPDPYAASVNTDPNAGGVDPAQGSDANTGTSGETLNNIAYILSLGGSATAAPATGNTPAQTVDNQSAGAPTAAPVISAEQSQAQSVLTAYLQLWQQQHWDDMVQYTTPSWRNSVDSPVMQLYYNHSNFALTGWEITAENQAANADSAGFVLIIQALKRNTTVKMQYNVLMFLQDGKWLVDPDSISQGTPIAEATPYAEGQAVPTPAITPTPTADPNAKVYWNTTGGDYYHADPRCSRILETYYNKMKEFTLADMSDPDHKDLLPCAVCGAPSR